MGELETLKIVQVKNDEHMAFDIDSGLMKKTEQI